MADAETSPKPTSWWRRWLVPRFSLRTLLIVTTLVAVVTGGWVARARRQVLACAAMDRIGEETGDSWEFAPWNDNGDVGPWWFEALPSSLRQDNAEHYWRTVDSIDISDGTTPEFAQAAVELPGLRTVSLSSGEFDDAVWEALGKIRTLRTVNTQYSDLDDIGLTHLAKAPWLEELFLSGSCVDASLRHLANTRTLRTLDLSETSITDEGVVRLARLTNLRELDLRDTAVTSAGVGQLGNLATLETLDLSFTDVDDGIAEVVSRFRWLQEFRASHTALTDAAGAVMLQSPDLHTVELDGTQVGRKTVEALAALPSLQHVALAGTSLAAGESRPLSRLRNLQWASLPATTTREDAIAFLDAPLLQEIRVGDDQLARGVLLALADRRSPATSVTFHSYQATAEDFRLLARNTRLIELTLSNIPLDRDALEAIAGMTTLRTLVVLGVSLDDTALDFIARLPYLTRLEIHGGSFTSAGLARLAELKQLEFLVLEECQGLDDGALNLVASWPRLVELRLMTQGELPRPDLDLLRKSFAPCLSLDKLTWGPVRLHGDALHVFLERTLGSRANGFLVWPHGVSLTETQAALLGRSSGRDGIAFIGDEIPSARFASIGPSKNLKRITFVRRRIDRPIGQWLASLPSLSTVSFDRCSIDADALELVVGNGRLQRIELTSCDASPEVLRILAQAKTTLVEIELERETVPSSTLAEILRCPGLMRLELPNCRLEPDAADTLVAHGKELCELQVQGVGDVGPRIVESLESFPSLERLLVDLPSRRRGVPSTSEFDATRLEWIRWARKPMKAEPHPWPEIDDENRLERRELDASSPLFHDSLAIEMIRAVGRPTWFIGADGDLGRPTLEELARLDTADDVDLSGTRITDDDLGLLARMTRLRTLDLSRCAITDAGVAVIAASCPRLRTLYLNETPITDAAIDELAKLKQLGDLEINDTKITPEGLARLRKLHRRAFMNGKGHRGPRPFITTFIPVVG